MHASKHLSTSKSVHVLIVFSCDHTHSIYAIGDCITGPMLAHKAEDEGEHLLECIFNVCNYRYHLC